MNNSQETNHMIYCFTVYLQTKPETVHKRIRERHRKEELNISMVRNCHYNKTIFSYSSLGHGTM